jgi:hypothetical protein
MIVERDQIRSPTPPPPPLPIADLIDDDAVNPGAQSRLAPEPGERPKDAQKNLLRHIERFVAVAKEMECEVEDSALVRSHEIGARRLIAGDTPLDERSLAAVNF